HARSPHFAHPPIGPGAARVGYFGTHSTDLARCAAGESGVFIPSPASPGASGLDQSRVGRFRTRTPCSLLSPDHFRTQTAGFGEAELGPTHNRHRSCARIGLI